MSGYGPGPAPGGGGGGGVVGFTTTLETASPNNTVNASYIIASGGTTDQDFVAAPKGAGAFLLTLATGDAVGGNKRGVGAVDLQIFQTGVQAASDVASGNLSAILGGAKNMASADYAVAGGYQNHAQGIYSLALGGQVNVAVQDLDLVLCGNTNYADAGSATIIGGSFNSATGQNSTIIGSSGGDASGTRATILGGASGAASGILSTIVGGDNNHATGDYSVVIGGSGGTTRGRLASQAYSSFFNSLAGENQSGLMLVQKTSTDDTPVVLTSDTGAASDINQMSLPDNATYMVRGYAAARESATSDSSVWKFEGAIKRGSGAASTALMATITPTLIVADAGAATWALAVTADTTNGALSVTVTGEAAKTLNWVAELRSVELCF